MVNGEMVDEMVDCEMRWWMVDCEMVDETKERERERRIINNQIINSLSPIS